MKQPLSNKKGFTLIELLAVIVILAIILLIATPIILGVVEKSRKSSWRSSAHGIIKAAEYVKVNDFFAGTHNDIISFSYQDGIETSSIAGLKLDYRGETPQSGTVVINKKGEVAIALYNGTYCAKKKFLESDVTIKSNVNESECVMEEDLIPPQITILGENPVYIDANSIYMDAGAEAIDDVDGDITHKLIITESINLNVLGSYTVTYKVTDLSGNTAIATRTVIVKDDVPPIVSGVEIDATNIEIDSFTITRNGDASDEHSGLVLEPYKYQISTDNTNWITKCTNNLTTCNIIGLNENTTYYYRVCVVDKASNEICINSKNVNTLINHICGDNFVDPRDGKSYTTVKINNQCWFAENLKYTGNGCLGKTWSSSTTNACMTHTKNNCSKTNSDFYCTFPGTEVLYQWGAASCPTGWHIPTDEEWMILEESVESSSGVDWNITGWRGTDVGKNLKSNSYWNGANSVGFNILPVGYRNEDGILANVGGGPEGSYNSVGYCSRLWTSSVSDSNAWCRHLYSIMANIWRFESSQSNGYAVRCVQ